MDETFAEAYQGPLREAADLARGFLGSAQERAVGSGASRDELHRALGGPLPAQGCDPQDALRLLAAGVDPGLVVTQSPRFFGFVIGGAHPAALAADWLTSAWDQNAGLYVASPAAAVVENVAAGWLVDLLRLPPESSVGFVTGAQMATWTCLAAARHSVLAAVGWDVERRGLREAPAVHVVVGEERHGTVDRALRFLGLGTDDVSRLPVDGQGRIRPEQLEGLLAGRPGPAVVVAQAGNVNTGSFDPVGGDLRRRAPARGLGARRRRVRALGAGQRPPPAALGGGGAGRLLERGRAQVAERALRQRHRNRPGHRGAPGGARADLGVPGPRRRRPARPAELEPRALPARPRLRRLGAAARAGARRRRGPRRPAVRPGRALRGRARGGRGGEGPQRGVPQPGPRPLHRRRRPRRAHPRSRRAGAAGGHLLDERDHLAGACRDADLGVELGESEEDVDRSVAAVLRCAGLTG